MRSSSWLALALCVSCGAGVTGDLTPRGGSAGSDDPGGHGGRGGMMGGSEAGRAGGGDIAGTGGPAGIGGASGTGAGDAAGNGGAAGTSGPGGTIAMGGAEAAAGIAGSSAGGTTAMIPGGVGVTAAPGGTAGMAVTAAGGGGSAGGSDTPDGGRGALNPPPAVACAESARFARPVLVPGLNDFVGGISHTRFTANEQVAYMAVGPSYLTDIAFAARPTRNDRFGVATFLTALNLSGEDDGGPMVTTDGLTIYMHSSRRDGAWGLYESTRSTVSGEFPPPTEIMALNAFGEGAPYVAASGNLYFHSFRNLNLDLFVAKRSSAGFRTPEVLSVGSSTLDETDPVVSPDELAIYFNVSGRATQNGVWMATRRSTTEPFGDPHFLWELSGSYYPTPSWVSPDACRFYLAGYHPGTKRSSLYMSERLDATGAGGIAGVGGQGGSGAAGAGGGNAGTGGGNAGTFGGAGTQGIAGVHGTAGVHGGAGAGGGRVVCSSTQPFGIPSLVAGLNDYRGGPGATRLSRDELVAYTSLGGDLAVFQRPSPTAIFGPHTFLTALSSPGEDAEPTVTADGLAMYFTSSRSGAYGLYVSTRATTGDPFGTPSELTELNLAGEGGTYLTEDGRTLYFHSWRNSQSDIWRATKDAAGRFTAPVDVGINTTGFHEYRPVISADELTLYYQLNGTEAERNDGVYMATRASSTAAFTSPRRLSELNAIGNIQYAAPSWISPDGCRLYFSGYIVDTWYAFLAERTPR